MSPSPKPPRSRRKAAPRRAAAAWPRHPLVYQINTRVWLRELAKRGAKPLSLAAVPEAEIERLARLGFDALWLMGAWTPSPAALALAQSVAGPRHAYDATLPGWTRRDILGSPYAVGDYRVSELLGGPDALAELRARLRAHGLGLILDFVPNHTAIDHPLTLEKPEAFVAGAEKDLALNPPAVFRTARDQVLAHGKDPNFPAWIDTAQIDVSSRAGRQFLTRTLREVATQCDGVRCDMAMLLLPDIFERTWGARAAGSVTSNFWREVTRAIRREHADFLFVAEAYWDLEARLEAEGFDFCYDKQLYDRLRDRDGGGAGRRIADHCSRGRCCHFTENHDEERAAREFGDASAAAAIVALGAPGMRLIHDGQLEGRRVRVPVQLGRRQKESIDEGLAAFYGEWLSVLREPALRNGGVRRVEAQAAWDGNPSHGHLVVLAWSDADARLRFLLVANPRDHAAQARLPIPELAGDGACWLLDRWDGQVYERERSEMKSPGLYVALPARGFHMFELLD